MKIQFCLHSCLVTLLAMLLAITPACSAEEWLPGSTEPPPDQQVPALNSMMSQAGSNAAATSCPAGFSCMAVITGETVCVPDGQMVAPSCTDQASCASLLATGTCVTNFGMMFCVQPCTPN